MSGAGHAIAAATESVNFARKQSGKKMIKGPAARVSDRGDELKALEFWVVVQHAGVVAGTADDLLLWVHLAMVGSLVVALACYAAT
ncbi:hypothetical protein J7E62_31650 [Variovorax paradoxus]|nr:hypothetical protein [Variovorax paradoxus]